MWWVYRVICATPNHYYVGITQDPAHRFKQHQTKRGSEFTKRHGYLFPEIVSVAPSEQVAKMAEKLAVRRLQQGENVVCGGGWTCER